MKMGLAGKSTARNICLGNLKCMKAHKNEHMIKELSKCRPNKPAIALFIGIEIAMSCLF